MHLASTTITLLVLIEPKKIIEVIRFMRTFIEPLLVVPHLPKHRTTFSYDTRCTSSQTYQEQVVCGR